jgi:hypothetical protein
VDVSLWWCLVLGAGAWRGCFLVLGADAGVGDGVGVGGHAVLVVWTGGVDHCYRWRGPQAHRMFLPDRVTPPGPALEACVSRARRRRR